MATRTSELGPLLEHIKATRGFDFTGYKRPSLTRRIQKRLEAVGIDSYEDYQRYLDSHDDEYGRLFDTILINVTGFFRDTESWDFVAEEIIPRLVEEAAGGPIRIWSTGCATGEEAYTLAILLAEALGDEQFRRQVKIYATDVDEDALTTGRQGRYPAKHVEAIPEELRAHYFDTTNGGTHTFRPDLRRAIIFGRHDLVQDPPISRIDLLVSRNTLMYFTAEAQMQILANFHFALRDGGYLFLGKSEVLVSRLNLFMPVDLKRRVFTKVLRGKGAQRLATPRPTPIAMPRDQQEDELRDAAFENVAGASLIVDTEGRLVRASAQARMLFGLVAKDVGRPLQDLEVSYRPVELRSRIDEVYTERRAITLRDVEWKTRGGETRYVDVQVAPLATGEESTVIGCSVVFTDVTRYRLLQRALQESKREVEVAYEELQSTVEELETTNEELQSTNEELETTNEELQSANEELETMNEELQSTNEELETMNDELRQRTDQLNDVNAFLESILAGVDSGVVALDGELRVRAWNEEAQNMWGLRTDEVLGRHFLNLDIGLPVEQLRAPFRACLNGDHVEEVVLSAVNRLGRTVTCSLRIAPFKGPEGRIDGVIVLMQTELPEG